MSFTLISIIGLLAVLIFFISRSKGSLPFMTLFAGFIIKIIAGVIFLEIYTHHYGTGTLSADANKFIDESRVLNEVYAKSKGDYFRLLFGFSDLRELGHQYLEETHHWDTNSQLLLNDNRNLMRVHSVIYFVSKGDIQIHLIIFAFISLLSVILLTSAFEQYIPVTKNLLFYGLLFIPSVLFWSSSILKEPLLFLGMAMFLFGVMKHHNIVKRALLILGGSAIILGFKPYILFCLTPAVLVAWLYKKLTLKWFAVQLLALISISIVLLTDTTSGSAITHKLSRKQFDFLNISQGGMHLLGDNSFYYVSPDKADHVVIENDTATIITDLTAEQFDYSYKYAPKAIELKKNDRYPVFFACDPSQSYIHVTQIKDSPIQLLKNIPEALVNVLFRPFITDSGSWLIFPAIIETIAIWILLFLGLRYLKYCSKEQKGILIGIVTFVILLSLLIGWVTPVLGAINRYRIPVMLGLVLMGYILWSNKKTKVK